MLRNGSLTGTAIREQLCKGRKGTGEQRMGAAKTPGSGGGKDRHRKKMRHERALNEKLLQMPAMFMMQDPQDAARRHGSEARATDIGKQLLRHLWHSAAHHPKATKLVQAAVYQKPSNAPSSSQ